MLKYTFAVVFIFMSVFEPINGFIKTPNRNLKLNTTVNHDTEKILADLTSYHDYQDIYKEMMKISREAMDSSDEKRPRRLIGLEDYVMYPTTGDETHRRGGSPIGDSVMGRRRARSQALRREKLNSQSLRSHMQHTRHAVDYTRSMFNSN